MQSLVVVVAAAYVEKTFQRWNTCGCYRPCYRPSPCCRMSIVNKRTKYNLDRLRSWMTQLLGLLMLRLLLLSLGEREMTFFLYRSIESYIAVLESRWVSHFFLVTMTLLLLSVSFTVLWWPSYRVSLMPFCSIALFGRNGSQYVCKVCFCVQTHFFWSKVMCVDSQKVGTRKKK